MSIRIGVGMRIGPFWVSASRSTRRRERRPNAIDVIREQRAEQTAIYGPMDTCDGCRQRKRVKYHELEGMLCVGCYHNAEQRAQEPQDAIPVEPQDARPAQW